MFMSYTHRYKAQECMCLLFHAGAVAGDKRKSKKAGTSCGDSHLLVNAAYPYIYTPC